MTLETQRLDIFLTGFYLAKSAEGLSPNTIREYRQDFAHFQRWLKDPLRVKDHSFNNLTSTDLKAFLAWLRVQPNGRGKPLAPKTVYNAWVALRSFYAWYAAEMGQPSPMASIPAPKAPVAVIQPLSQDEVSAILRACDYKNEAPQGYRAKRPTANRDRAIVLFLLDSGLRASELCALTVENVDLESGRVLVKVGKGGKGRIVYIGRATRRAVWKYQSKRKTRPTDPLFVTQEERPFDIDRLRHLFDGLGERAGVANLHPHRLRHTFATEFLRNGGNLLGLQRLLGHSSLEMVRRYAAIADADLARAHETGSPVDRWRF